MTYDIRTDRWVLVKAEDDDGPLIIRLNQGVDAIRGHPDFAHQVGIAIPLQKANHLGFPDALEGTQLKGIEEKIIPELERDQDSVVVLVLTGGGVREFVLYTRSPATIQQRVAQLAVGATHVVQSIVQHDPDWEVYDAYAVTDEEMKMARTMEVPAGPAAGSAAADEDFPHRLVARFYENIEPVDREERYENPLQAALKAANAGVVSGRGSQLTDTGLLAYAEIEMSLADLRPGLDLTVNTLEGAGALRGSELRRGDEVVREFGKLECLAVFLDGVNLPQEVYDDLDMADLLARLEAVAGSLRGTWAGSEETGLFYSGPDAEELLPKVEAVLRPLPIGQNARLVARFGKPALNPKEIRLPMKT